MKLIYPLGDYDFKLPKNCTIVHWVPVIFPPCRNVYFFSKNVENTFNPEVRNKIIKGFGYRALSIYDTCGYNPLLYLVEDISLNKTSVIIEKFKEEGIDISPSLLSYSTPKSIFKRFGMRLSNDTGVMRNICKATEKRPQIIDLLEYIAYNNHANFIGNEFKYEFNKEELLKSKKEVEQNIIGGRDLLLSSSDDELFKKLSEFCDNDNIDYYKRNQKTIRRYLKNKDILKYIYFAPIVLYPISAIIFISSGNNSYQRNINCVAINKLLHNDKVIDIYQLYCSRDEFAIKIWAESIEDLDDFIYEYFYSKNINTSTKVILRPWKKEGWHATEDTWYLAHRDAEKALLDNQIISILNSYTENLPDPTSNESIETILNVLRTCGVQNVRKHTIESRTSQILKNNIEKYSIDLDQNKWIKTLVFIKAASGTKDRISAILNTSLLGISEISFARKFYHITGEYDFIVPIYFSGLAKLRSKIQDFSEKASDLVSNIRIYIEISDDYIGGVGEDLELNAEQLAYITSHLPNAIYFSSCCASEIAKSTFRYSFYEHICRKYNSNKVCKSINYESISQLVVPTLEIKSSSLIHMFIRFRIDNHVEFNNMLDHYKLVKTKVKLGITLKIFNPMHDKNICFCVLTASSFKIVIDFINDFDASCRSILPNLIFSQSFFEPSIPNKLRCRPCLTLQQKCKTCRQYAMPRSLSSVTTKSLGFKEIDKCKIEIIQCSEFAYPGDYDKLCTIIKTSIIDKGVEILVFPELTIRQIFIPKIKELLLSIYRENKINKNIFIIPGSQFADDGDCKYEKINLLFLDKNGKIHEYSENYRNYDSSHDDIDINLAYGNNGVWRYTDTGYGNFIVLNCFDFIASGDSILTNIQKMENRVDLVIVVAKNYNKRGMKSYSQHADSKVLNGNFIIAIANNSGEQFGNSGFWTPLVDSDKQCYVRTIDGYGDDSIILEMNAIDLDKSRCIGKNYLSREEESYFKKKYSWRLASQNNFGPIHLDLWFNQQNN